MELIPHRELRNNSSAVLHRVSTGTSVGVTNHGTLVAMLVPPPRTPLSELAAAGRVSPAGERIDVRTFERIRLSETTADVLDDLRGDR
jgi:prevent-host-death family protein